MEYNESLNVHKGAIEMSKSDAINNMVKSKSKQAKIQMNNEIANGSKNDAKKTSAGYS